MLCLIYLRICHQIFINLKLWCFHTTLETLTRLDLNYLSQPITCSIVDRLGNIKTKVKSAMVRSSENSDNLMLSMLSLWYSKLRKSLFKIVGINESCFMSQKLLTRTEVFREQLLGLSLNNLFILVVDSIPKFWFSFMNKVNTWQIKVFSMPTKESLPAPEVNVRSVYTFNLIW